MKNTVPTINFADSLAVVDEDVLRKEGYFIHLLHGQQYGHIVANGRSQYADMPDCMTVNISLPQIEDNTHAVNDSAGHDHLENRCGHFEKERVATRQHTPAHQ